MKLNYLEKPMVLSAEPVGLRLDSFGSLLPQRREFSSLCLSLVRNWLLRVVHTLSFFAPTKVQSHPFGPDETLKIRTTQKTNRLICCFACKC